MSKRRSIILSVVLEGRTQAQTASLYGVSECWVTGELLRHLTLDPTATTNPKKRPRSSYVRFEADLPNEMWQSDFTHWRLATGADTEIITWLDDHSRYVLSVTVHRRITGPIVVDTFNQTCADHRVPASTLTDNAMVYTTRFSGGKGGRNAFEARLAHLGTEQKNSAPNHPTICGKVERFQQTLKKWLTAQHRAHDLNELQGVLNEFTHITTTTTAPTDPSDAPHQPPPTTGSPKPAPKTTALTSTSESATTASTKQAPSHSATTANSTTSASAEPTNTPP